MCTSLCIGSDIIHYFNEWDRGYEYIELLCAGATVYFVPSFAFSDIITHCRLSDIVIQICWIQIIDTCNTVNSVIDINFHVCSRRLPTLSLQPRRLECIQLLHYILHRLLSSSTILSKQWFLIPLPNNDDTSFIVMSSSSIRVNTEIRCDNDTNGVCIDT